MKVTVKYVKGRKKHSTKHVSEDKANELKKKGLVKVLTPAAPLKKVEEEPEEFEHIDHNPEDLKEQSKVIDQFKVDYEDHKFKVEYEEHTIPELKDILRERDLKVSGNKGELIARLEGDDESSS